MKKIVLLLNNYGVFGIAKLRRATSHVALVILVFFMAAPGAYAGVHSGTASEPILEPARVASFAARVEQTLADSGARVAIIARNGRPENQLPKGVQYTHVAFAVYSTVTLQDGTTEPGYAMYNLYQHATQSARSFLLQDSPYQFFAPVPALNAGIIVPVPEVQKSLLQVIASETYSSLHNPSYSVIANPYNNDTQNCTEFTLNVLQAAIYNTNDMAYIKSATHDHFSALQLDMSPIKLIMAATFLEEISIADHPTGVAETATFGTIKDYLNKYNLVKQVFHLKESI